MIECLQTTSIDHISVKQLCSTADINRSTFYFYYQDLQELYSELEEEFLKKVDKAMFDYYNKSINLHIHLLNLVKCYDENSEMFLSMVNSRNKAFYNAQKAFIEKYHFIDDKTPEERDYFIQYYISGITGVITHWILTGKKQSPEYIASFLANNGRIVEPS
ncbi:MAG: TetR family transcriptional regulator C-terminal domain-containing protein [Sphaerochaetaceae bacterium]|nr:TetR family transcriptional regulator C-terminal domain-containing protein [Sphaerochaetaceae bacterium]